VARAHWPTASAFAESEPVREGRADQQQAAAFGELHDVLAAGLGSLVIAGVQNLPADVQIALQDVETISELPLPLGEG